MGGHIKVEAEKLALHRIHTKIEAEIFEQFQKRCKEKNLQMSVVVESFIRQYCNSRYPLSMELLDKWSEPTNLPTSILNTPVNKEVYDRFKKVAKMRGYAVRHILSAFIEDYGNNEYELEFYIPQETRKATVKK